MTFYHRPLKLREDHGFFETESVFGFSDDEPGNIFYAFIDRREAKYLHIPLYKGQSTITMYVDFLSFHTEDDITDIKEELLRQSL